jgi:hypothetical protein
MDAIADAIRPIDGTQDAEASRQAMDDALADLLERDENADLTQLDQAQIDFLVEAFVGRDLCLRIELDIGRTVEARSPDAVTAVRRIDEMREYVMAKVATMFAARRARGERFQRQRVAAIVEAVLVDTLSVFEDYLQ